MSGCSGGANHGSQSGNTNVLPSLVVAQPTQHVVSVSTSAPIPLHTNTPVAMATATPSNVVVNTAVANTDPVMVEVNYTLPKAMSGVPTTSHALRTLGKRNAEYISSSNTQLNIAVTPIGGSTTNSSGLCTSITCTVSFTASPGLTFKDGGGTVLSTLNTLNFSASPVVKSLTVQLASATVSAGSPVNDVLTVNALDADGNTIVGNTNYVDTNGNPVLISLDVTNTQTGGKGTVAIQGPSTITAPPQSTIVAHYDGNWLDHADISVTSSSSAVTNGSSATLKTTPTIIEYSYVSNTTAHTMTYGAPVGIAVGSDGNFWVPEFGSSNGSCMLKVTTTGMMAEYCTGITSGAALLYDAVGADGRI